MTANGAQSHNVFTKFEERVVDVLELHLKPRDKALVRCVDEKSRYQPLYRSQSVTSARAATTTRDHKRHGDTTMFAALDVRARRRRMPAATPSQGLPQGPAQNRPGNNKEPRPHLVLDNYATHKPPQVKA